MIRFPIFFVGSVVSFAILLLAAGYELGFRVPFAASLFADVAGIASSTPITATKPTVIDALQQLQDREQALETEVANLQSMLAVATLKADFPRTLHRGNSGSDVEELQTLLAELFPDETISVTGYFGATTAQAVSDFQSQAGIQESGVFDAQTRDSLALQSQSTSTNSAVGTTTLDYSSITDPQQLVQQLGNQISQLSSQLSDTQSTLANVQSQVSDLASSVSNLQAANSVPPASAPPQVQSLSIANIQASAITKTSATIAWTTNNPATGEVDYSQNSSMPVNQTFTAKATAQTTSHSFPLSQLVSGVTYYYHVISKDSSGTTANSTNLVFTTSH